MALFCHSLLPVNKLCCILQSAKTAVKGVAVILIYLFLEIELSIDKEDKLWKKINCELVTKYGLRMGSIVKDQICEKSRRPKPNAAWLALVFLRCFLCSCWLVQSILSVAFLSLVWRALSSRHSSLLMSKGEDKLLCRQQCETTGQKIHFHQRHFLRKREISHEFSSSIWVYINVVLHPKVSFLRGSNLWFCSEWCLYRWMLQIFLK